MHYLALVGATALTLITGWCVAALVDSIVEKTLAALLASVTQVVVTMLFAGLVLESLSTATVLVVNVVVTGTALAITARATSVRDRVRGAWATARGARVGGNLVRTAWAWVLGVLVAIETAYLALAVYVLPPATWDTMTYHLVAVAEWIRGDRILQTPLVTVANTYPMNGELTFLWVGSLTRSDLLVDLPQLGFALLGAFAVVAIARSVGVSRPGSIVAGCLYFLTPIVLAQASTNYVDVVFPGLFLAGYALLLRFLLTDHVNARRATTLLVLAGAAVGLAAGSKSIGVIYAVVSVAVLLVNLGWRRRRLELPWKQAGVWLLAFVVPVLALGSFWYVRTWVEYDNPTYPFAVQYAGVTVFDGVPLSVVNQPPPTIKRVPAPLRLFASWGRLTRAVTYDQRFGGFGPQWLLLELPALVLFTIFCARRRRRVLYAFVVPFVVILIMTPSSWWSRFTIFFVAPGAIALVFLVERVKRRNVALLVQGATVVLVVAGCAISVKRFTVESNTFTPRAVLADARKPTSDRTIGRLVLPEYAWTDAIPRDSRIGVHAEDLPDRWTYPLFGADFRNEVVELTNREMRPTSLVPSLRARDLDYFVAVDGTSAVDIARGNRDALEPIAEIGDINVYRVR